MRRRYSSDFSPPAAVAPVLVTAPVATDARRLEGKVDSGADVCAIPEDVIRDLELPPVRSVRAAGFGGGLESVILYHCAIEFAGHRFDHVEALATRRRYAIIGRNVLNALDVALDGPARLLTIVSPHVRCRRRRSNQPNTSAASRRRTKR